MLSSYSYCYKCVRTIKTQLRSSKRYVSDLNDSLNDDVIKYMKMKDNDGIIRSMRYVDIGNDNNKPPIVCIGGTAQSIVSFHPHIRPISKTRRLIIPELRCQGETDLLSQYGTIQQHCEDLKMLLQLLNISNIHLSGYSFGGRVGIAFAHHYPSFVSRLSITAVPLVRTNLGNIIINSWQDGLQRNNLRDCAWSFMLNGYSASFLEKYADRIPSFVDMVIKNNKDPKKLLDLIVNSHVSDDNPYSVKKCAEKIACPTQIIGATEDRIAGFTPVLDLAKVIEESSSKVSFHEVIAGHLAPFEQPNQWRKLILEFFN